MVCFSWLRLDICFMSNRGRPVEGAFMVVSVFVMSLLPLTSDEDDWRPTELLGIPELGII